MGMRRRTSVATISILAVLLALVPACMARAASKTPTQCSPGHPRIITASANAEVFAAPEPGIIKKLGVYGCVYGHRSYYLGPLPYGSSEGGGGVEDEVLAGPIVAFEESSTAGPQSRGAEWHVIVRNLSNGRLMHRVPTGTPTSPNPLLVGAGFTSKIVVKIDGAVAWIVEKPIEGGTNYEVHALNATGTPRLLASATDIGPTSLALVGNDLYWTQGGQAASALLD